MDVVDLLKKIIIIKRKKKKKKVGLGTTSGGYLVLFHFNLINY
jgi:hypothetical protein